MTLKPKVSAEDIELFRREVGPVKPLRNNAATPTPRRPQPLPRQALLDQQRVLEEMLTGNAAALDLETGDELVYIRAGMQRSILRKLRRGHYSVHGELDLHGMTVPMARQALAAFIQDCRAKDISCVRIIHGKGINSRDQRPVLKGKVDRWLQQRDEVLAYCSARPMDGGSGAIYVLLKRG